jgi:hypothetical protein
LFTRRLTMRTVRYEGIADEPFGAELERLTEIYYQVYSDGRTRRSWPALIYIRVQPTWIRYSDTTKIRLKSPNSMRKPCSRPNPYVGYQAWLRVW